MPDAVFIDLFSRIVPFSSLSTCYPETLMIRNHDGSNSFCHGCMSAMALSKYSFKSAYLNFLIMLNLEGVVSVVFDLRSRF